MGRGRWLGKKRKPGWEAVPPGRKSHPWSQVLAGSSNGRKAQSKILKDHPQLSAPEPAGGTKATTQWIVPGSEDPGMEPDRLSAPHPPRIPRWKVLGALGSHLRWLRSGGGGIKTTKGRIRERPSPPLEPLQEMKKARRFLIITNCLSLRFHPLKPGSLPWLLADAQGSPVPASSPAASPPTSPSPLPGPLGLSIQVPARPGQASRPCLSKEITQDSRPRGYGPLAKHMVHRK